MTTDMDRTAGPVVGADAVSPRRSPACESTAGTRPSAGTARRARPRHQAGPGAAPSGRPGPGSPSPARGVWHAPRVGEVRSGLLQVAAGRRPERQFLGSRPDLGRSTQEWGIASCLSLQVAAVLVRLILATGLAGLALFALPRSEERRVGKEGGSGWVEVH